MNTRSADAVQVNAISSLLRVPGVFAARRSAAALKIFHEGRSTNQSAAKPNPQCLHAPLCNEARIASSLCGLTAFCTDLSHDKLRLNACGAQVTIACCRTQPPPTARSLPNIQSRIVRIVAIDGGEAGKQPSRCSKHAAGVWPPRRDLLNMDLDTCGLFAATSF
jgi:hypothetical protein